MRHLGLILAALVVSSTPVWAQGQQQLIPPIPGITAPTQPQQRDYQRDQGYQRDPGYQQRDQGYRGAGDRCQEIRDRQRDLQDRLADAPRSGREHDQLVYQLGQAKRDSDRCR